MSGGYSVDAVGVVVLSDAVCADMSAVEADVSSMAGLSDELLASLTGVAEVHAALSGVLGSRESLAGGFVGLARGCVASLHQGVLAVSEGDEAMRDEMVRASGQGQPMFDAARFGQAAL